MDQKENNQDEDEITNSHGAKRQKTNDAKSKVTKQIVKASTGNAVVLAGLAGLDNLIPRSISRAQILIRPTLQLCFRNIAWLACREYTLLALSLNGRVMRSKISMADFIINFLHGVIIMLLCAEKSIRGSLNHAQANVLHEYLKHIDPTEMKFTAFQKYVMSELRPYATEYVDMMIFSINSGSAPWLFNGTGTLGTSTSGRGHPGWNGAAGAARVAYDVALADPLNAPGNHQTLQVTFIGLINAIRHQCNAVVPTVANTTQAVRQHAHFNPVGGPPNRVILPLAVHPVNYPELWFRAERIRWNPRDVPQFIPRYGGAVIAGAQLLRTKLGIIGNILDRIQAGMHWLGNQINLVTGIPKPSDMSSGALYSECFPTSVTESDANLATFKVTKVNSFMPLTNAQVKLAALVGAQMNLTGVQDLLRENHENAGLINSRHRLRMPESVMSYDFDMETDTALARLLNQGFEFKQKGGDRK